ncbi:hypothetical protein BB560_003604 [Smittium megazygosporum]|uniref:RRM domain-containing protein n=1 Tax=Smittium megazygosporum TaxID=133381 RepID=A0A2T9ZBJ5_9FUNG|nr:hypothetical protein BB560_003604 [Smittium megazygosporum]
MESEQISTIFVVGFPDDMKEREFQSMFTFAAGFETAKLKIPSPASPKKDSSTSFKKQIIGFAKFRSRQEAIEARDMLNYKKIDYGQSILKADLAKKNLNSKKYTPASGGTSLGLSLNPSLPYASRTPSAYGINPTSSRLLNLSINASRSTDILNDPPLFSAPLLKNSEAFKESERQFDTAVDNKGLFEITNDNPLDWNITPTLGNPRVSSFRLLKPSSDRLGSLSDLNGFSKNNLEISSFRSRLGNLGVANSATSTLGLQTAVTTPISALGNSSYPNPFSASTLSPAPGLTLQSSQSRNTNNSDRNPPCNTLYVGNLPVSTTEEELRKLFQNIYGYKRMIFKTKPNSGPMCFVEFKDISCATLAIREFDGYQLSHKTNSGIRLSYSKNPLGVKSTNNINGKTTPVSKPLESPKDPKTSDFKFTENSSNDNLSTNSSNFVNSFSYNDNFLFSNNSNAVSGLVAPLKQSLNFQSISPNSISSFDSSGIDIFSKPLESKFIHTPQLNHDSISFLHHDITQSLN